MPDAEKVFSADRSRAVAWYVLRRTSDRYDTDTDYEIVVWDAATHAELYAFLRSYEVCEGRPDGHPVTGARFTPDGRSVIISYSGADDEVAGIP